MKLGFFLSCEEFGPRELVAQARAAEGAGFHGLWISDHYHPWNHEQGQSPFVWSVIGAIAGAGVRLPLATAVTCPTVRTHPAVIAQAAATSAVLLEGRFSTMSPSPACGSSIGRSPGFVVRSPTNWAPAQPPLRSLRASSLGW